MQVNPPPPIEARFGQRLGIVSQLYAAFLGRLLEPHDLTWPQFALLLHMARRGGPARISEMAIAVDLTQPAVTKIVQKFQGLGLAEVLRDSKDARNRPVRITPQGLQRLGAVQQSFGPAFDALLQGWQPEELEILIAGLARISERLEDLRSATP